MTGDNGLLQKTGQAKKTTETATALEKIQAEIVGSYGLDGKIDLNELNKNLKRINGLKYNDADIVLDGESKNIVEELPAEVSLDKNSFYIGENGNVLDWKNADIINENIGETISGYSAANLDWQVYYADPVETFLISKQEAKTSFPIPLTKNKQSEDEEEYNYKGSEDVRKTEYGSKWNKMWLKKCTEDTTNNGESTRNNAKATAYMCDSSNWIEYKADIANYAVGGATTELLIASWNKSQKTNIKLSESDITPEGYKYDGIGGFLQEGLFTKDIKNGVYGANKWAAFWFSSPCAGWTWGNKCVSYMGSDGILSCIYWDRENRIRPIVSIPTSKITVNGNMVTVNP